MAKPPDPLPPEVMAAFERGQPIEAIKLLIRMRASSRAPAQSRARRPAGPAAANPAASPPVLPKPSTRDKGLSPGEVPRSNSAFWGWMVVVLLTYLAYRFLR